jgi:hypothetical protein
MNLHFSTYKLPKKGALLLYYYSRDLRSISYVVTPVAYGNPLSATGSSNTGIASSAADELDSIFSDPILPKPDASFQFPQSQTRPYQCPPFL